jgi:hypothetical protein
VGSLARFVAHILVYSLVLYSPTDLYNPDEESCSRLKTFTNACVCLATPQGLNAVGQCYLQFNQITDGEVRQILAQNDPRAGLEQQSPLTGALP